MITERKMLSIELEVQNSCKYCHGKSCPKCKHKVMRFRRYAKAEIPLDFWNMSISNYPGDKKFKKAIVEELKEFDNIYNEGKSYAFVGNYGTGKSSMANAILKIAVTKGYSAFYSNMSDVIDEVTRGSGGYLDKLMDVDFLCIDEFDSRWVYPSEKAEQLFGQTMERILRKRFQNQMVTIICSNTPKLEEVLSNHFRKSIESLFSKYLKIFYVSGKDQRKIKGN